MANQSIRNTFSILENRICAKNTTNFVVPAGLDTYLLSLELLEFLGGSVTFAEFQQIMQSNFYQNCKLLKYLVPDTAVDIDDLTVATVASSSSTMAATNPPVAAMPATSAANPTAAASAEADFTGTELSFISSGNNEDGLLDDMTLDGVVDGNEDWLSESSSIGEHPFNCNRPRSQS